MGSLMDGDHFGISLARLADMDGDGVDEVAVGAPYDNGLGVDRGALWILSISRQGSVRWHQKVGERSGGAQLTLRDGDHFGFSVCKFSDIHKENTPDIFVGAPYEDEPSFMDVGALYAIYLKRDGTMKKVERLGRTAYTGAGGTSQAFMNIGWTVAAIGDINQDGWTDMMFGMPGFNDAAVSPVRSRSGAAFLVRTREDGRPISTAHQFRLSAGNTAFLATSASRVIGQTVASVGDINQDGIPDMAFGDRGHSGSRGRVLLNFMRRDGTVLRRINLESGARGLPTWNRGYFGQGITSAGDLNQDGIPDIIVGSPLFRPSGMTTADWGAVWFLFMDAKGNVNGFERIDGGSSLDLRASLQSQGSTFAYLGWSVAFLGDMNGDGTLEVAAGVPYFHSAFQGAVYILHVNRRGRLDRFDLYFRTEPAFYLSFVNSYRFGHHVAAVGDIDGDGVTELAVTGFPFATPDAIGCYILYLNPDGSVKIDSSGSTTTNKHTVLRYRGNARSGRLGDPSYFRFITPARAGDLNEDGVADLLLGLPDMTVGSQNRNEGAFAIAFMNTDGTVRDYQQFDSSHEILRGQLRHSQRFGEFISMMPDMDADGMGEVLIGDSRDAGVSTNQGAVWIVSLKKLFALGRPATNLGESEVRKCMIHPGLAISIWQLGTMTT